MIQQSYGVQYSPTTNKNELLSQINSAESVQTLINSYLGLAAMQTVGDKHMKEVNLVRISRPLFTYEFVHQLRAIIDGFLNFSIQFSRWEHDRIIMHCKRCGIHLTRFIATSGDDNYISEKDWQIILQIHDSEGGWGKFGITWEYNKPVNSPMLMLVKNRNEELDQIHFYSLMVRNIIALIEGSMNKGYANEFDPMGQLPKVSTEIRQENTVIRDATTPQQPQQGGQQWT
jgi:hypothetical protein